MNDNSVAPGGQAYPPLEATIARAHHGRVLAKSFTVNGSGRFTKAGSPEFARKFDFERLAVRDLAELAAVLTPLSEDRAACLLHGRAKAEGGPQPRWRAEKTRADGSPRVTTIDDAPSALIALDIDKVPAVDANALAAMTPEQLCGYVMACVDLPEYFWGRPCILQLTGSHGIDPGCARVRLFFGLDRALNWREREALVKGAGVDEAVFKPEQCVFTARPVFTGGVDPYPERIFFVDTPFAERVPVPGDLVAIGRTKGAPSTASLPGSMRVEGAGWRRFIDAAEAHFFVECQSAVGAFVANEGPDADPAPLFAAIDEMLDEKARPARGADYVATRKADARVWWRRCADMTRAAGAPQWDDLAEDEAPVFVGLAEIEHALSEMI